MAPGEPCPWFIASSSLNNQFHFSSTAGRYNVLCLFGSAANPTSQAILTEIRRIQKGIRLFDIQNFLFTGVSIDPEDKSAGRLIQDDHAIRWFWDFDQSISRQLGCLLLDRADPTTLAGFVPQSIVLDERLRVMQTIPIGDDPIEHVQKMCGYLTSLPPLAAPSVANVQAPVLIVPRVFEPALCEALINYYEKAGGQESGFMREVNGMTVPVHDYSHKRRTDCQIEDEELRRACMVRIHDRLTPEIHKAYQFVANRMERYIVACYDASTNDHFRAHRDNTTKGTAHRRFAVSLVLNAEAFEGGYLRFPEFGRQLYAPPSGGAVVFSCSLLHEATPVTKGRRFVFLPFLYDDAAAKIRDENLKFLGPTP
jgi:predicted 2-oxoglutarate/Fe(II)-dependent dioxygenase YbiX/peroxiredoxin